MKKLLFLLLLVGGTCFAQSIGKSQIKIYGKFNPENIDRHDLWLDKDGIFMMTFDKTTVGVKHAEDMAEKILKENGLSFDKPDEDSSLLDRMVKGIHDYRNLDYTLQLAHSEIKKSWHIDGGIFALVLNRDIYTVFYAKEPK